jgi:4-hydroxy-4-methyl-2-oxoglutarate aldolase
MIEAVATLTLKRDTPRPPKDLVDRFRGAMTGHLVDSMSGRGALIQSIKPQQPELAAICGPALTVHCYPADNLALLAATALVQPGDVVVCATDGFGSVAVTGDLLAGMLKNAGAVALVTDGTIRDQDGVEAVGLPIFHAGVTPNSPASVGPGEIGLPILCGGVPISTGDIVVGDRDGIVIIPMDRAEDVFAKLELVRGAEAALEAKMKAGLTTPDHIRTLLASDHVRWT